MSLSAADPATPLANGQSLNVRFLLGVEVRSGDVIAVMSNGGFGGTHEKLLAALGQ